MRDQQKLFFSLSETFRIFFIFPPQKKALSIDFSLKKFSVALEIGNNIFTVDFHALSYYSISQTIWNSFQIDFLRIFSIFLIFIRFSLNFNISYQLTSTLFLFQSILLYFHSLYALFHKNYGRTRNFSATKVKGRFECVSKEILKVFHRPKLPTWNIVDRMRSKVSKLFSIQLEIVM